MVFLDIFLERNRFYYDMVWGGFFLRGEDGEVYFYIDFGFFFYNDYYFYFGYFLYVLVYYVRYDMVWV